MEPLEDSFSNFTIGEIQTRGSRGFAAEELVAGVEDNYMVIRVFNREGLEAGRMS